MSFDLSKKLLKKAVNQSLKLDKLKSINKLKLIRKGNVSKIYSVDCIFYTRFGKCKDQQSGCPYNHDPAKVAICTR